MTPAIDGQVSTYKLIAYYPFNGNSNDESGNGNEGTVHGATLTADRFGIPDRAYYFDGINDHIYIPNSSILQISPPISMSSWFRTEFSKPFAAIFCKGDPVEPRAGYLMDIDDHRKGRVDVYYNHATYEFGTITSDDNLDDNQWHFMVATYDGTLLKLYVDGKFDSEVEYKGGMKINDDPLLIGWDMNTWLSDRYFKGEIDEVMIYNRILDESEINEMFDINNSIISGNKNVCQGKNGEIYQVLNMGGMSDYQWSYSGNGVAINGNSEHAMLDFSANATSGLLTVVGEDEVGMPQDTAQYEINIVPVPTAIASSNSPICSGNSINLYAQTIPSGNYFWEGPNGFTSTDPYTIIQNATSGNAGTYWLTVFGYGCSSSPANIDIAVQNCSNTGMNTDLSVHKEVDVSNPEIGEKVTFTIRASNNGPNSASGVLVSELLPDGYTFSSADVTSGEYSASSGIWSIGDMGSGESQYLTLEAFVNQSGNYQNTAIIQGDINEISVQNNIYSVLTTPRSGGIPVPGPDDINIPNAFSPNGDGINDVFVIRGVRKNSTLNIFNRLGKEVYRSDSYENDWDGRDVNGEKLKTDTYWYILKMPGMPVVFKGYIYLKQ